MPYYFCIKRDVQTWGIGRELYTAPFIWVPVSKVQIVQRDNKYYCNERFSVSSIAYNDSRNICGLSIANSKGDTVYEWEASKTPKKQSGLSAAKNPKEQNRLPAAKKPKEQNGLSPARNPKGQNGLSAKQKASLEAELRRTGVAMEAVQERYHIKDPAQISEDIYGRIMEALSKTKPAQAA